jgi:hypothetical protein
MVKKTAVFIILVLMAANGFAQQDSTKQTFRIKGEHKEKYGVFIGCTCWDNKDSAICFKYLWIDESNEALFSWKDSASMQYDSSFTDYSIVKELRNIITFQFVSELKKCNQDTSNNFSTDYRFDVGVYNNGNPTYTSMIYFASIKKYPCLSTRLSPLIAILNKEYRKYSFKK